VRRQLGGVEFIIGRDETTVLDDEGLPGSKHGGPSPVDLVYHLSGSSIWSGSTPIAIAGRRAHRAGTQRRRMQGLLEGQKRLTRLAFTGKEGAT